MVNDAHPAAVPDWLARLYPFSPKSFRTPGGARMSYLDEGPRGDEAVLMLHGNPTWSFYYRDLVKDLSPGVRCIAPDHIGMGLSDKPGAYDYNLASRIADVEALVASLGLRRVHLVVHDWGGAIGFGLATRNPGLIGRIVITNTAAFPSDRIPARIALCRAPLVGEFIVRGLNGFAEPATWMAMASRRLTWDERKGYLHPYGSWANRIGVHRFVRDIPLEANHPSRATLEEIARGLPRFSANEKMILWGAKDFCFDDTFLSRWLEIYPGVRVDRLPSVGHYVLEDGGNAARTRITDFLRRQ
jgi:cis-3-alkyl-4-acyloxetan-2-one decarboxylase